MKIGIVTQSLLNNYGGILQNYALQKVLKDLGHEPITIDYVAHYSFRRFLIHNLKTIFYFLINSKNCNFISYFRKRKNIMSEFVSNYIITTNPVRKYSQKIIDDYNIETLIVGSDQVWRPQYNNDLEDMYFYFVKEKCISKIAYAASFGVDIWEYTKFQTLRCKRLIKRFDAVSVREDSGISLCQNFFDMNVEDVLDPTLLLSKEEYKKLCENIPKIEESFLLAYILDTNNYKNKLINDVSILKGIPIKKIHADNNATLSIPEWLSLIRDAEYVVTDSFHGMLFSVIFNKQFIVIANKERGLTRFTSFLKKFKLLNRLVFIEEYSTEINDISNIKIDYNNINSIKDLEKDKSVSFICNALKKHQ